MLLFNMQLRTDASNHSSCKIRKEKTVNDYIFEPSKEEIVKDLIPKSLKINCTKHCLIHMQVNMVPE